MAFGARPKIANFGLVNDTKVGYLLKAFRDFRNMSTPTSQTHTVVHKISAGYKTIMDDRLSKLAKAAAASIRGEDIDPNWIFEESLALLEQRESFQTNALWHTLVDSACALNDVGEYALGGEVFETLLEQARDGRYPKIEFDALEGLAQSWFYLGDHRRAFEYLNTGLRLAKKLNRRRTVERFQESIDNYREGKCHFPAGGIKAPTNKSAARKNRRAHVSSLQKKERNR